MEQAALRMCVKMWVAVEWSVEWQPQRRMRRRLVPATHYLLIMLHRNGKAHELDDARVAGDTREHVEVSDSRQNPWVDAGVCNQY